MSAAGVYSPVFKRMGNKVNFEALNGCWEWLGAHNGLGYGRVRSEAGAGVVYAHRAMFELVVGPIPPGMNLDHLCRNPKCVNPEHLEPVTQRENVLRGVGPLAEKARQTHCLHGHEFTAENTRIVRHPKGSKRRCMTCHKAAMARYFANKKAAQA